MNAVVAPPLLMTTEEMLQLPENGVERDLIRGRLKEKPMTRRGRKHTRSTGKLAKLFGIWWDRLPEPRGEILVGDAAFRLSRDPDSTVGIDLALLAPDQAKLVPENAYIIDVLPILAVEILSPTDTQEGILEKVRMYLEAGIPLVWILEPVFRTVTIYQPGQEPVLLNATQELSGEPHLPGFRAQVADLF